MNFGGTSDLIHGRLPTLAPDGVDDLNWRLGIPVSLKDNEGKSKINFELVWREISKLHSFGLSIEPPIGGTIF